MRCNGPRQATDSSSEETKQQQQVVSMQATAPTRDATSAQDAAAKQHQQQHSRRPRGLAGGQGRDTGGELGSRDSTQIQQQQHHQQQQFHERFAGSHGFRAAAETSDSHETSSGDVQQQQRRRRQRGPHTAAGDASTTATDARLQQQRTTSSTTANVVAQQHRHQQQQNHTQQSSHLATNPHPGSRRLCNPAAQTNCAFADQSNQPRQLRMTRSDDDRPSPLSLNSTTAQTSPPRITPSQQQLQQQLGSHGDHGVAHSQHEPYCHQRQQQQKQQYHHRGDVQQPQCLVMTQPHQQKQQLQHHHHHQNTRDEQQIRPLDHITATPPTSHHHQSPANVKQQQQSFHGNARQQQQQQQRHASMTSRAQSSVAQPPDDAVSRRLFVTPRSNNASGSYGESQPNTAHRHDASQTVQQQSAQQHRHQATQSATYTSHSLPTNNHNETGPSADQHQKQYPMNHHQHQSSLSPSSSVPPPILPRRLSPDSSSPPQLVQLRPPSATEHGGSGSGLDGYMASGCPRARQTASAPVIPLRRQEQASNVNNNFSRTPRLPSSADNHPPEEKSSQLATAAIRELPTAEAASRRRSVDVADDSQSPRKLSHQNVAVHLLTPTEDHSISVPALALPPPTPVAPIPLPPPIPKSFPTSVQSPQISSTSCRIDASKNSSMSQEKSRICSPTSNKEKSWPGSDVEEQQERDVEEVSTPNWRRTVHLKPAAGGKLNRKVAAFGSKAVSKEANNKQDTMADTAAADKLQKAFGTQTTAVKFLIGDAAFEQKLQRRRELIEQAEAGAEEMESQRLMMMTSESGDQPLQLITSTPAAVCRSMNANAKPISRFSGRLMYHPLGFPIPGRPSIPGTTSFLTDNDWSSARHPALSRSPPPPPPGWFSRDVPPHHRSVHVARIDHGMPLPPGKSLSYDNPDKFRVSIHAGGTVGGPHPTKGSSGIAVYQQQQQIPKFMTEFCRKLAKCRAAGELSRVLDERGRHLTEFYQAEAVEQLRRELELSVQRQQAVNATQCLDRAGRQCGRTTRLNHNICYDIDA